MNQDDINIFEKKLRESQVKYKEFMKKYRTNHEVCPKCGTIEHSSTLVGYVYNSDKSEEYKDLNACVCVNCGNRHTTHERVSRRYYNWHVTKRIKG